MDGLEVAYKYVPAKPLETHGQGIQTQVGGDWYDIIPLSAGRVGIVIGDVEGRGARAAAVMGQLRAALRAFAQDDKSPAEILRRLDDWVRALGPAAADAHGLAESDPPTVSCTYLVYDAWARTLSFSNAGHVPPLIVRGHDVSQLEIRDRGVLLGVRGKGVPGLPTYREEMRYLAPGSTLIFYTDGLVDRRQRADGSGHYTDAEVMHMLRDAVRTTADGTVEQVAEAAEYAVPGEIDDDMAVVVVRTSDVDLASWEGQFPAEPIRVSEARRLAHRDVRLLGHGGRAGRPDLPAGLRGRHERGAARGSLAHAAARAGARGRGPGPLGILGDWEIPPFDENFTGQPGQGLHAPAAARARGDLGRGLRLRPPAAADPQRRARATRAAAGCTWSISSRPGGAHARLRTARQSGSRCRSRDRNGPGRAGVPAGRGGRSNAQCV